jgi:hypothetical protein
MRQDCWFVCVRNEYWCFKLKHSYYHGSILLLPKLDFKLKFTNYGLPKLIKMENKSDNKNEKHTWLYGAWISTPASTVWRSRQGPSEWSRWHPTPCCHELVTHVWLCRVNYPQIEQIAELESTVHGERLKNKKCWDTLYVFLITSLSSSSVLVSYFYIIIVIKFIFLSRHPWILAGADH